MLTTHTPLLHQEAGLCSDHLTAEPESQGLLPSGTKQSTKVLLSVRTAWMSKASAQGRRPGSQLLSWQTATLPDSSLRGL